MGLSVTADTHEVPKISTDKKIFPVMNISSLSHTHIAIIDSDGSHYEENCLPRCDV